jgi:hypothetical protein
MTLTLPTLLQLVLLSVRSPREGARTVIGLDLPRTIRWQALLLFVVIGAMLAIAITYLITGNAVLYIGLAPVQPLAAAIMTASGAVMTVFAIFWIGRAMGGSGRFADTISVVAWMQAIVICLQIAQLAVFLLIPPLSVLADITATMISVWILTNFIAELHGFKSLAKVLGMIVVSLFAIAFGLSMILAMIGFSVPGVSP